MSDPMISIRGLEKSYGSTTVLRGIDLDVRQGEIFALLGPNGAGKTTTVNILTTLVKPAAGTARVAGVDVVRDPRAARARIALTGQYASVDEFQTGEENLAMMARLAHLPRAEVRARTAELLERFGLTGAARRRVATYSGGMRRRLDLAISLVSRPPVLVLDEPTTGLDPHARNELWDVVRGLAAGGTTVLLTTQYLEEADRLADTIAVLDEGHVVARGSGDELKGLVTGDHVRIAFADARSLATARALGLPTTEVDERELSLTTPAPDPVQVLRRLLALADEHDLDVAAITVVRPTLDDVFLALTGHAATAPAPGAAGTARPADAQEVAR